MFKKGGIQLDIEKLAPNKSLIDQILEMMFNSIRNKAEFNEDVINDLMHLAVQGQLNNHEKIKEKIQ